MDEFYDPYLYDLNVGPGSRVSETYLAEAMQGGGPVLELGCGTGNVLLPIAQSGLQITGIDASDAMLSCLKKKLSQEPPSVYDNVQLLRARIETFALPTEFQQIFMPNDLVGHLLTEADLKRTLNNNYKHLSRGGTLVLDISFFDVEYLARFVGNDSELLRARGVFTISAAESIQVWERTKYDQQTGILTALFRYELIDDTGRVTEGRYRQLELNPRRHSELLFAMEAAGFTAVRAEPININEQEKGWLLHGTKP